LIRLRSGAIGHPVRTLCGMAYNYVITYRLVLWVIVVLKQEESLIIPLSWFFRDYVGQVYSWTKTYSSISPTNIYSCCRFIAFSVFVLPQLLYQLLIQILKQKQKKTRSSNAFTWRSRQASTVQIRFHALFHSAYYAYFISFSRRPINSLLLCFIHLLTPKYAV